MYDPDAEELRARALAGEAGEDVEAEAQRRYYLEQQALYLEGLRG